MPINTGETGYYDHGRVCQHEADTSFIGKEEELQFAYIL